MLALVREPHWNLMMRAIPHMISKAANLDVEFMNRQRAAAVERFNGVNTANPVFYEKPRLASNNFTEAIARIC